MTKVLVLYYPPTVTSDDGERRRRRRPRSRATVDIKRVPELVPPDVAKASYYKVDQTAPVAKIEDLANYDAIHRRHRHPLPAAWHRRWRTSSIRPAASG